MAGAFLISENVGVSMSSVAFDHIIEKVRGEFSNDEFIQLMCAFLPYDEEGMMFVDLRGVSDCEFDTFYRATMRAMPKDISQNKFSPTNEWGELHQKLSSDQRANT